MLASAAFAVGQPCAVQQVLVVLGIAPAHDFLDVLEVVELSTVAQASLVGILEEPCKHGVAVIDDINLRELQAGGGHVAGTLVFAAFSVSEQFQNVLCGL